MAKKKVTVKESASDIECEWVWTSGQVCPFCQKYHKRSSDE